MPDAARWFVSGRVQGVAFRAHAREQACALGLSGHARNLRDGRVEVYAVGTRTALDALERWLGVGSPAARVSEVQREAAEVDVAEGFSIG